MSSASIGLGAQAPEDGRRAGRGSAAGEGDIIDRLAGVQPGSRLDAIRRHRAAARDNAQRSWQALFEPDEPVPGRVSRAQRLAVAAYVAGLHRQPESARFYADLLGRDDGALADAVASEIDATAAVGPYGHYPAGPLSREDRDSPTYGPSPALRSVAGDALAGALAHAHLLVFHPRDARREHLQALLDLGWSETDIVILSQLVAFLSFQVRVVAGLRVLAASLTVQPLEAAS